MILNIDVQWTNGRLVHVHCVGEPVVPERQDYVTQAPIPLAGGDVTSLDALKEFLTELTRMAPDLGSVDVIGYDPDIFKILQLLAIEGPAPDPITVALATL